MPQKQNNVEDDINRNIIFICYVNNYNAIIIHVQSFIETLSSQIFTLCPGNK